MAMRRIRDEEINEMVMESDDAYEEHLRSDSAGNDSMSSDSDSEPSRTYESSDHTHFMRIR
jgi:hypothetical protein